MTTMQLNAEITNQLRLISDNNDLMGKVLDYIKSLTAHISPTKKEEEAEKTRKFLDSVCGKWEDERSAEEIIADIYSARKSKDDNEYANMFD